MNNKTLTYFTMLYLFAVPTAFVVCAVRMFNENNWVAGYSLLLTTLFFYLYAKWRATANRLRHTLSFVEMSIDQNNNIYFKVKENKDD